MSMMARCCEVMAFHGRVGGLQRALDLGVEMLARLLPRKARWAMPSIKLLDLISNSRSIFNADPVFCACTIVR